ncbi:MAG: ABC transporter substrate-binding protein [Pseudomonadota bacterium]
MTENALSIVGVPEHFNLPWLFLVAKQSLSDQGISLEWQDVPQGTGAMIDMLNDGTADIALLLTEGAIAGVARGDNLRLLGGWIDTPLQWGVHVAGNSARREPHDLIGGRFAISRFGSGSHLMAGIYADQPHWAGMPPEFVVVDTLDGARKALANNNAEIFLWERYTTKPYVDNGEFRRVDILPTPWPCFVACARADLGEERQRIAFTVLQAACDCAAALLQTDDVALEFSQRYALSIDDVRDWLQVTRWSTDGGLPADLPWSVGTALLNVKMIDALPVPERVFAQHARLINDGDTS